MSKKKKLFQIRLEFVGVRRSSPDYQVKAENGPESGEKGSSIVILREPRLVNARHSIEESEEFSRLGD